jgi:CheY-like chemotaxis protein
MPTLDRATPTTVLIVENEALVCLELVSRLAEMGLSTLVASNADEAIDLLDSHPEIEVLLTDVRMPRGSMDGVRLAHHVRDRWPPVKIIVVSGDFEIEPSDLPPDSLFLTKPCNPDVLMDALAHMINGRGAGRPSPHIGASA